MLSGGILRSEGQGSGGARHDGLLALDGTGTCAGSGALEGKSLLGWSLFLATVLWHADVPVNEHCGDDVERDVNKK